MKNQHLTVLRQKNYRIRLVRTYSKRNGVKFALQERFFLFGFWTNIIASNSFGVTWEAEDSDLNYVKELALHWLDWDINSEK